uniref:Nodule-specific cysteine-rich peptide G44 n=1 Tax=Pisum sativum TaxID=3888 RepID=A0A7T8DV59_PEA|nr:nodule-specific cysteine-rich peptide G44 [Pisum sativum]
MDQIFKCVCPLIIFLSLFLVVNSVDWDCTRDIDCPSGWCLPPKSKKCIESICFCLPKDWSPLF